MTIPLQLRGVRRTFRRRFGRPPIVAIAEATFELAAGEIACVVGAAGSGKTTVLRLAAGLLRPDAGVVHVAGAPPYGPRGPAVRRLVGFAPRDPAFPPAFTVREVLEYCARRHDVGRQMRALVRDAVDLAGLEPVVASRATALPLAAARRLGLAQCALGGRRLLLVDDPFAGLDAISRRDLCDRLQRCAAAGATVLLSSADPVGLERLVDRVLVLRSGRVVRDAPATVLLGGRVLEVIMDAPPREPPPGFRVTATGVEADLGHRSAESALAVCRAHRLGIRASRVRLKGLDDALFDPLEIMPR
ncbi:MAG: ATP-binding cassette domain-containing protein [Gemmatimonadota bacterium]